MRRRDDADERSRETLSDRDKAGGDARGRAERMARDLASFSRPRRTGSVGERETIERLREAFSAIGLPVSDETFAFSTLLNDVGARIVPLAAWSVLLTAMALQGESPVGAFVLFAALLAAYVPGTRWSRLLERFYDLGFSVRRATNLVSVVEPEEVRGRLVLMAHHDSKSQTFPLFLRLSVHTAFFAGVAGVSVMYIALTLVGATGWMIYLWFPSLLLGIPLFLAMVNFSADESPGAIDNASGLAILLETARALAAERLRGIEVVFLLTGAEEEGLAGAVRFAQSREGIYIPHNTYVIGLDGVGSPGGLVLSSRHGFPPVRTGGRLETILAKVAGEMRISLRKVYVPLLPGLEHVPIAHRGYRSVTLTSSDFAQATLAIHTGRDTPDNVDPAVMADCVSLLLRLVREIDEGVSRR